MQFKSEYLFTIISIMFNRGNNNLTQIIKLTQILGIYRSFVQKRFYKIISKEFQKIL